MVTCFVSGLILVGCSNQQSQLSGTWENTKPDTSSGINYIAYTVDNPAGYNSMEFLPGSKINVIRKRGENFVLDYTIISQGRLQISDKVFNYIINQSTLTFTDATGATTTFTKQGSAAAASSAQKAPNPRELARWHLQLIEGAKQMWEIEVAIKRPDYSEGMTPTEADLLPYLTNYTRGVFPAHPPGGTYIINPLNIKPESTMYGPN